MILMYNLRHSASSIGNIAMPYNSLNKNIMQIMWGHIGKSSKARMGIWKRDSGKIRAFSTSNYLRWH